MNGHNKDMSKDLNYCIIKSCNYHYYPDDIISIITSPKDTKYNGFALSIMFPLLSQIAIPSSVTKIGEKAFERCSSLKKNNNAFIINAN